MKEGNFPQLTQYLESLKVSEDKESESQAAQLARIKFEEEEKKRRAEFEFLSCSPLIRYLKEAVLMLSESSVYWRKKNEVFGWTYSDEVYIGITNPKVAPPDYPVNLRLAWEISNYFDPDRSSLYRWKEVNISVWRDSSGEIGGCRFNVNKEDQELARLSTFTLYSEMIKEYHNVCIYRLK